MVETADDRLIMLADFGVSATYTPSGGTATAVTVIFDNDYIPVDTGASVAFAMNQPKAMARTQDMPSAAEGDAIVIGGVNYIIRVVMTDGTGMTEIMLEAE